VCTRFSAWHLARVAWRGYGLEGLIGLVDELSTSMPRRYNIPPRTEVPIIRRDSAGMAMFGATLANGRFLVNARAEQLTQSWKRCLNRRCLVPANGYFEWAADKQPWYFTHKELPVFCLAGLETDSGFVIVTTDANVDSAPVHERMPVVLEPGAAEAWLTAPAEAAVALAHPLADRRLDKWRVNKAAGNVKNESADLIEPVAEALFD
jgi:putative SOS response-associated peptidase YedK